MVGTYVAGPMRGYDYYNFPAFFEAEKAIYANGIFSGAVFNPARNDVQRHHLEEVLALQGPAACGKWLLDHPQDFDLRTALGEDLAWIAAKADALVLLDGWQGSKGAQAECALAKALGLRIYEARQENFSDEPGLTWVFYPLEPPLAFTPPDQALTEMMDALDKQMHSALSIAPSSGEVRTVSTTGGEKGVKTVRWDLLPFGALDKVAEHFGRGAAKYADHNWRRGYPWSRSYGAAGRHFSAFIQGEEYDICTGHEGDCRHTDMDGNPFTAPESPNGPTCFNHTGSLHLAAFAWHALVLLEFWEQHPEYDDRWIPGREGNLDRFSKVDPT
jgi:hypothetical protein